MENPAPIALFVYNRPAHTRKTVDSLARNEGVSNSELYIFSDAPRSPSDVAVVEEVRNYLRGITGFKKVTIIEQTRNFGLAKSIIAGVSSLCEKYGRVIVLEDDLETSPYFLNFMNDALVFYENTPEVMHVSGCRYPVEPFGIDDSFFLHVPLCWGWATWQRAWVTFEKDISVMQRFNRAMIRRFNFDDTYSYWTQLELNRVAKINTWFVFWYANLFLRGGLSLFPARSLVNNIGMDSSGVHSHTTKDYSVRLSLSPVVISDIPVVESSVGYEKHKDYFRGIRGSLLARVIRKMCSFLRKA